MAERLVDVSDGCNTVLHTFPVTIGGPEVASNDAEYREKALQAAAHAQLVPDAELKALSTRMHVDRGGTLAPYGDCRGLMAETRQGLDQTVRERAYFLWQNDGSPSGRADHYWHQAHEQRLRERAYVLWRQEGSPEGRADEHWYRIREFEAE